jgi:hypothetical protein
VPLLHHLQRRDTNGTISQTNLIIALFSNLCHLRYYRV